MFRAWAPAHKRRRSGRVHGATPGRDPRHRSGSGRGHLFCPLALQAACARRAVAAASPVGG